MYRLDVKPFDFESELDTIIMSVRKVSVRLHNSESPSQSLAVSYFVITHSKRDTYFILCRVAI